MKKNLKSGKRSRLLKLLTNLLIFLTSCSLLWSGVDLNGDADYIECGITNLPTSYPVSIMAIVDIDNIGIASGSAGTILAWSDTSSDTAYIQLNILNDAGTMKGRFVVRNGNYYPAVSSSLSGKVVLIGVASSSTDRKLYVNGSLDGTNAVGVTYPVSLDTCTVGVLDRVTGKVDLYNGSLTEVAVWDVALSANQIKQLSDSRVKGMPLQFKDADNNGTQDLQLYLPLDDFANGTALDTSTDGYKDLSGNGNHGTGVDSDGDSKNIAEEVLSYPAQVF